MVNRILVAALVAGLLLAAAAYGADAKDGAESPATKPAYVPTPTEKKFIETQINRLIAGGAEERWDAVIELANIGPAAEAAIPALVAALGDKDGDVRINAAEALGNLGSAAVPALLKALKDEDKEVVRAAVEVLGDSGDGRAVKPILDILKARKDDDLTAEAIGALGCLKAGEAAEPLIAILADKKSPEDWRHRAADALGGIGDKRAVPVLKGTLTEGDDYLKTASAESLAELGDEEGVKAVLRIMKEGPSAKRCKMIWALARVGGVRNAKYVPNLIEVLKGDGDEMCRQQAAHALGYIGPAAKAAVPELIAAMKDASRSVRRDATGALVEIGQPRDAILGALVGALDEKEEEASFFVAYSLLRLNCPEKAIPVFVKLLKHEQPEARRAAAKALGEAGAVAKDALGALTEAAKDADENVRTFAKIALEKIERALKEQPASRPSK